MAIADLLTINNEVIDEKEELEILIQFIHGRERK